MVVYMVIKGNVRIIKWVEGNCDRNIFDLIIYDFMLCEIMDWIGLW